MHHCLWKVTQLTAPRSAGWHKDAGADSHLQQHHADLVDQSDVFKDLQSALLSSVQLFNIPWDRWSALRWNERGKSCALNDWMSGHTWWEVLPVRLLRWQTSSEYGPVKGMAWVCFTVLMASSVYAADRADTLDHYSQQQCAAMQEDGCIIQWSQYETTNYSIFSSISVLWPRSTTLHLS